MFQPSQAEATRLSWRRHRRNRRRGYSKGRGDRSRCRTRSPQRNTHEAYCARGPTSASLRWLPIHPVRARRQPRWRAVYAPAYHIIHHDASTVWARRGLWMLPSIRRLYVAGRRTEHASSPTGRFCHKRVSRRIREFTGRRPPRSARRPTIPCLLCSSPHGRSRGVSRGSGRLPSP